MTGMKRCGNFMEARGWLTAIGRLGRLEDREDLKGNGTIDERKNFGEQSLFIMPVSFNHPERATNKKGTQRRQEIEFLRLGAFA